MVKEYIYDIVCDPGALHKQLVTAGFAVDGVSCDMGTPKTYIYLDDSETKDPSTVVSTYVYVEPVIPNYRALYANAQGMVTDAVTEYNNAKANYITALQAWNAAGSTVTSGNALVKLTACENMVVACATALEASKTALTALVQVVTVLAKERAIEDEE